MTLLRALLAERRLVGTPWGELVLGRPSGWEHGSDWTVPAVTDTDVGCR